MGHTELVLEMRMSTGRSSVKLFGAFHVGRSRPCHRPTPSLSSDDDGVSEMSVTSGWAETVSATWADLVIKLFLFLLLAF